MKILLIEPSDQWITNNKALKYNDQVMLPIGMMYLSSYVKEKLDADIEVKIISTIVDFDENYDLETCLAEFPAEIVGIKCVNFYHDAVLEIAKIVREKLPDALLVAGGPNITLSNAPLVAQNLFDLHVVGEGEETFLEIVQTYREKGKEYLIENQQKIRGLLVATPEKVIATEARPLIDEVDSIPLPDYSVIDLPKYSKFLNYGYNRRPMAAMFTSRGCPYKCVYCHVVFGKKFRARSVENILEEINYLYHEHGIEDYCIVDDIFNLNRQRLEEFCDALIKNGPKVKLYFPNGLRADVLSHELLDKMVAAGTIWITFSLETSSPRLQKFIKKYVKIDKLAEMVKYSCEKGVITNCCLMVGFPTETVQEAEESLRFFSQFDKVNLPYYFSVKYFSDTPLFNMADDYGIDLSFNSSTGAYHNFSFQETPDMSEKDFQKLNYWYLRNIFLNPQRIENSLEILRQHFTEEEINDMFSVFFRKRIKDVDADVLEGLKVAV